MYKGDDAMEGKDVNLFELLVNLEMLEKVVDEKLKKEKR